MSDTQETNRVVRLAKAHTDLALHVCKILVDQICFSVLQRCQWWEHTCRTSTSRVRDHGCRHVFAGRTVAPVTLVSWRSHRVKRVVASASAAEAMGLSEAIAQGDWVRALWSEMVLGLSLREWRERKDVPPLISVTDSKGNCDHLHNETIGTSEDRRSAIDLAIIREDLTGPQMFLRWVMERRKWQTS